MGILWSMFIEGFPPKSKFTVDDVPDLAGKVIIVTGGNAGLGKETIKTLLSRNAKVYMASRSESKAEAAIQELKKTTGKEAIFLKVDLADLKSVKTAAEEFISKEKELHVLINNGGVMMPPIENTTADGYDLQFGTNVLGHFYLTKLLLPTLLSTAKEGEKARVVNVSSIVHLFRLGSGLDFATFKDGEKRKKQSTKLMYCQSKYGNLVFSQELAKRYGDQGIVSVALNPGNLKTDLLRHLGRIEGFILNLILQPVQLGALTLLYAGTAPEAASLNGKYLRPWARLGKPRSVEPKLEKDLWTWMEEQVKDI